MKDKDQLTTESRLFLSVDISMWTAFARKRPKALKSSITEVNKTSLISKPTKREGERLLIDVKELTTKRKKKSQNDSSVTTQMECTDSSETWKSDASSSEDDANDDPASERFLEKVQMDVDDMSAFGSDSDEDEEETTNGRNDAKWEDFYQQSELHLTLRDKCLGLSYRFQRHIAGGDIPPAQALSNTGHVHIILQEMDPQGTGLDCLVRNKSFDIWDKWTSPRLREKELNGSTIRLYFRSLESFLKWVKEYKNPTEEDNEPDESKLTENVYNKLLRLLPQLPNYSKTIHRRTATDFSSRLVTEAYERLTNDDLQLYEDSTLVKDAVKLLGKVADGQELSLTEFTMVRDYLMTQFIIDNASGPDPIQNAKLSHFKTATPNSTNTTYHLHNARRGL